MKTDRKIFLVLAILTLLLAVSAVNAVNDTDDVTDTTVISDTVSESVSTEPLQTTGTDEKVADTRNTKKVDKNIKTSTKTVEVNNMDEMTNTITSAINDPDNDEYIINLNEGTYQITNSVYHNSPGKYAPNIIINANNQTWTATTTNLNYYRFNNKCNLTINDAFISLRLQIYVNATLNNVNVMNDINNYGVLTLKNVTFNSTIRNRGTLILDDDVILEPTVVIRDSGDVIVNNTNIIYPILNTFSGNSTFTNITIDKDISNNGVMTLKNVVINKTITNNGKLIICDDTTLTDTAVIQGNGEIEINDTTIIAPFLNEYDGNYTITNAAITTPKNNLGNLTIVNSTINSTIKNTGIIFIDDDTVFGENAQITGLGYIVTNDITRLLPYIQTISGNYTITDITLDRTYNFNGNITLENCNIIITNNENYGILNIKNSNIQVEEESTWIKNYGLLIIDENSKTSGNISNYYELYTGELPEDYSYNPRCHILTNETILFYFDTTKGNTLSKLVNEGDTLDFQGTISGVPGLGSLVINKPVNIITTSNDGRIENFGSITYTTDASGSNITGLYTYNTQFYVRNAHDMVFNNISNVVISKGVGWGVGQTSIRENSTNITVQNSYFYTKDNGGSSTFVFGWADNSTLINSTIEADGNVGNLVYLTTYNVDVPSGVVPNSNNKIINNTIRGPDTPAAICWAIVLSGMNNIVDGNTINYSGTGITGQWGSGITGEGVDDNETSLVGIYNNKVYNNKIDCGVAFTGMTNTTLINNTIYNNGLFTIGENNIAYNNTANNIKINGSNAIIKNNTFTGTLNITSSNNQITDNRIITDSTYTMTGSGKNNTITDNYLKANTLYGDASINLNHEQNTITNNKPRYELIIDPINITTTTTTITANIYFDDQPTTDINTGRVYFKANGKVLRDDTTSKIIYVDLTDGVATLSDYKVPANWNDDTEIKAVYTGSAEIPEITSQAVNPTITTPETEEPEFTVSDITTKAGEEVTITVTTKNLDAGKVVLKVNGKTVKSADGKLYAKTNGDTTTFTYTVPKTYKAGEYSIKAVYTSGTTKLEAESKLTVE